jgi:hypothetical protein
MSDNFRNFAEFWPYYLSEHAKPTTRALHFAGTGAGLLLFMFGVVSGNYWLLLVALVCGYGPAWIGHFFVEKQPHPASRAAVLHSALQGPHLERITFRWKISTRGDAQQTTM